MISLVDGSDLLEVREMYEEVVAFGAKHLDVEAQCGGELRDPVFLHGDLMEALAQLLVDRDELRREAVRLRAELIRARARAIAHASAAERTARDNARDALSSLFNKE